MNQKSFDSSVRDLKPESSSNPKIEESIENFESGNLNKYLSLESKESNLKEELPKF